MRVSSAAMIKISDKISISVFSFAALFLFFYSQGFTYALILLASAALHEFAHLFFLCRFGTEITSISVFPFGIDIRADTSLLSYKKELICTLAGSFSNLIFAFFSYLLLLLSPSPVLMFFALSNLFLGLINLIPLSFFDGGKAIRLILYDNFDIDTAFYLHKATDILASAIFLFLCLFAAAGSDFNISVCAVICYASVSTLALRKNCRT